MVRRPPDDYSLPLRGLFGPGHAPAAACAASGAAPARRGRGFPLPPTDDEGAAGWTVYRVKRRPGVRWGGKCLVCGRPTGWLIYQKALTAQLYRSDGKPFVAHPGCIGVAAIYTKAGAIAWETPPPRSIQIFDGSPGPQTGLAQAALKPTKRGGDGDPEERARLLALLRAGGRWPRRVAHSRGLTAVGGAFWAAAPEEELDRCILAIIGAGGPDLTARRICSRLELRGAGHSRVRLALLRLERAGLVRVRRGEYAAATLGRAGRAATRRR